MVTGVTLDGETADRITALTLMEHRGLFAEMIKDETLHDEDRGRYVRYSAAIDTLLNEYFGVVTE
jgi:hypothetical protein